MNTIGFAITGSYCTFSQVFPQIQALVDLGYNVIPIMSGNVYKTDTRFGKANEFIKQATEITRNEVLHTITQSEPIGPKNLLDALIIAPCTGNTIGKLACGITDTSVTMAAKASLRNNNPLILAVSTNDALGASAKNIGLLLNTKNVYFVPFSQDAPDKKPESMVAKMELIPKTLEYALKNQQLQPVIR